MEVQHLFEVSLTTASELELITDVDQITCPGSDDASISVGVTGGSGNYTYAWSNAQTTATIDNLSAGTYTVTVEEEGGCSAVSSFIITAINPLEIIDEVGNVSCGESGFINVLSIGGTGPYTYEWSNGVVTGNNSNLNAGVYFLTVTDANNCQLDTLFVIEGGGELQLQESVQSVSCFGANDGSIDVVVVGGVGPFAYDWSNGGSTSNNSNLQSGLYTVVVTDMSNGCTAEGGYLINEPNQLNVVFDISNVSCFEGNDGSVAIAQVTGGVAPYVFSWEDGSETPSLNGLVAGTYNVTVQDGNNCTLEQSISIIEPAELEISASIIATANAGIDLTVTGGTEPYAFSWNNGANTEDIFGLAPGEYEVQITDANGCTYFADYEILFTSTQSIEELSSWELYPVPAKEFVLIDAMFTDCGSGYAGLHVHFGPEPTHMARRGGSLWSPPFYPLHGYMDLIGYFDQPYRFTLVADLDSYKVYSSLQVLAIDLYFVCSCR